jgi:hypothetical protein
MRKNFLASMFALLAPAAVLANSLPIGGYQSGTWYDPAHSGEGIQTQVGDFSPNSGQPFPHYVVVQWFTFDYAGNQFWLSGSAGFATGQTAVQMTLAYANGGGFAGIPNYGLDTAAPTIVPWGTITIDFPDCNSLHFSYNAGPFPPQDAITPRGQDSRTWQRITAIQGLQCGESFDQ